MNDESEPHEALPSSTPREIVVVGGGIADVCPAGSALGVLAAASCNEGGRPTGIDL